MTTTEDFLAHYGIPGMKWGVRRDNPSGSSGGKFPKASPKGAPDKTPPKPKLTNDQMRKQIEGIELSRKLNALTAPSMAKTQSAGSAFARAVLRDVASPAATAAFKWGAQKGLQFAMERGVTYLGKRLGAAGKIDDKLAKRLAEEVFKVRK